MADILVKEDVLNQVLNYLAARPYAEVHQLLGSLMSTAVRVEEKIKEVAKAAEDKIEEVVSEEKEPAQ